MRLKNKTIATLIAEGVEDLEYYVPVMRLQEEGAKVLSAGLDLKLVRGKNGLVITPDAKIEDLKASEL
ncbi:MAG TPA: DJ-1/PfpI family protein, partial [Anaerolineales bacterium]|nr:DJ-1/PfpI family protein [Anaerolineales bacterium]